MDNTPRNTQFTLSRSISGFHQYDLSGPVLPTYISRNLCCLLGLPEEQLLSETQDLYAQRILPADQESYREFLETLGHSEQTRTLEYRLLRQDGSVLHVRDTMTSCFCGGKMVGDSVLTDITERHRLRQEQETRRYLEALTEVYDKIFEYDLGRRTVKCLYGHNSPMFRWVENIPMQMEDATLKWILGTVFEGDRDRVRRFFSDFWNRRFDQTVRPPLIRYRALSSNGTLRTYTGLLVTMDASVSLFCCRNVPETEEADSLRSENASLRSMNEHMQQLVMQFTDGLAAFEILDDVVTPLYASDNVCSFFGFTREEWLSVMKKRTPIRQFVSRSKAAYEDFLELLAKGEAEFTYYDLLLGRERRIRAICSQKSPDGTTPRYVMLYNIEEEAPKQQEPVRVRIRTFGYFDVFVDDRPIAFRNEKSKELFALLVDRRGGYVTSEEAIGYLWEEEPANSVTLARYRKVALRLKNLLEEYGIAHVVESVNGKRRLVPERVTCDLYDYLSGQEEHAQLFKGSYLTNYSWGETTLAELTGNHFYAAGE